MLGELSCSCTIQCPWHKPELHIPRSGSVLANNSVPFRYLQLGVPCVASVSCLMACWILQAVLHLLRRLLWLP